MIRLSAASRDLTTSPDRARWSAGQRRAGLLIVLLLAVAAGMAAGQAGAQATAEPSLARLLRLMAGIKAIMALGAFLLLDWRLSLPVRPALAGGYVGAAALMAAASALIWQMSHLIVAGAAFHAGLLVFLGLAYVDRGAASDLLEATLQRRIQRRQERP